MFGPQRTNLPLLQVSLANTIEPIRAQGRYGSKDDQTTRSTKGKIPLVFDSLEAPRWGHISAISVLLVNGGDTQHGHVHTVGTVWTLATASVTRRAKCNTNTYYWCLLRSGLRMKPPSRPLPDQP